MSESIDEVRMRKSMLALITIQRCMKTLQVFMDKKDETANTLSDIWNAMLDYRMLVIESLSNNDTFKFAGLPQDIVTVLNK